MTETTGSSLSAGSPCPAYMEGLNPPQGQAVETLDGPVLILAGAGTGKTRVLTTRLAHLLYTRRAFPSQIMAVTFTNKAATEMRERVASLIGGPVEGWWLGTFHSLAARILRRHAELVGLKSNFTILDTDDQIRLIKQLQPILGIDNKKWPARVLLNTIERWKDQARLPESLGPEAGGDLANGKTIKLYQQYQDRLRTLNACDFGDLLLHVIRIWQEHPDILAEYHRRLRYLLVDEYQDTNVAQYLWLRLLAQKDKNLCCVGDDDQSIYGWRGAEVGNILRFETDFPGATIIRLEQNYRSTGHILGAASALISQNEGRLGKTLWTASGEGETVKVEGVWDADDEARHIGDEIEAEQRRGRKLSDIAVLVRASFQMRSFEERFISLNLPYRVVGGPRFYERMEIRDAIAYFRVTVQPDDDLALERIINTPKRQIGPATMQKLNAHAREMGVSLHEAVLRLLSGSDLPPRTRNTLRALTYNFELWRRKLDTSPGDHVEIAQQILDESGYTDMWKNDKNPEAPGRLENLKELIGSLEDFDNLPGFLEHVSLVMENQQTSDNDAVSLMTLHSAKGLEFNVVFLPGWEEGVFPNQRALDETGLKGLEEERRLAYVGLTRAREKAVISHAANRLIYGQWSSSIPSRFVEELPDEHIESNSHVVRQPSAYGFPDHGSHWERDYAWSSPSRTTEQARYVSGPLIEQKPARPHIKHKTKRPSSVFKTGDRVVHDKYGGGLVLAADGDKLTISFDKAGEKKIIDSFVEPENP